MRVIALFFGKIYTPETNFTRPPVVTVATNINSASKLLRQLKTLPSGPLALLNIELSLDLDPIPICACQ